MKIMKNLSFFLILLAGILWGSMGIFVRVLTAQSLGSMEIVTLRAVFTASLLFIWLFLRKRELLNIRWKDLWCFLGTGFCSIVFFNFCYFRSITLTSMSVAAVLLYTAPAIVMVISRFLFQEAFTGRKILAIIMTFLGCVCVSGVFEESAALSPRGFLVGLGAGFGYALYSIFSRFALERGYHSLTITFYTFLFAAFGTMFLSDRAAVFHTVLKNPGIFLFSIVFALVCTIIPYLAYTAGLEHVENGQAAVIASVEPVAATVLGMAVYQEALTFSGILGIVLVLGGIMICNRS